MDLLECVNLTWNIRYNRSVTQQHVGSLYNVSDIEISIDRSGLQSKTLWKPLRWIFYDRFCCNMAVINLQGWCFSTSDGMFCSCNSWLYKDSLVRIKWKFQLSTVIWFSNCIFSDLVAQLLMRSLHMRKVPGSNPAVGKDFLIFWFSFGLRSSQL